MHIHLGVKVKSTATPKQDQDAGKNKYVIEEYFICFN